MYSTYWKDTLVELPYGLHCNKEGEVSCGRPLAPALFATAGLTQHTANTDCTLNISKDNSIWESENIWWPNKTTYGQHTHGVMIAHWIFQKIRVDTERRLGPSEPWSTILLALYLSKSAQRRRRSLLQYHYILDPAQFNSHKLKQLTCPTLS